MNAKSGNFNVKIGNFEIGTCPKKLFIIAGPCVMESFDLMYNTAKHLKDVTNLLDINFIFKCSFDKANRTSIDSFRGPGLVRGLEMMMDIKTKLDIPTLTDVHESIECTKVASVVDVLQIPAFLCRQTDLIMAAANTGKPVNIKKGQFLSPHEMQHSVNKVLDAGNNNVLITERGTTFGYNNLVVDFRSIPIMQQTGCPVVFDATHSVQLPGAIGNQTGGERQYIPILAKAALIAGANGLFMEVHPNPDEALSDAATQLPMSHIKELLEQLVKVFNLQQQLRDINIPRYKKCTEKEMLV